MSDHVKWLRQYARGVRQAARREADGTRRAQMEEVADRLLAAAAELVGFRFADYARVDEVAGRLGIHPESARRLMRQGKLPAARVGNLWLVKRGELEEFAEGYAWGTMSSQWKAEVRPRRERKADSGRSVRGWMKVGSRTDR